MRLEPLYRVQFTTVEAWNVELSGKQGLEGQGFLVVEGRSQGRVVGRFRAANYPRHRTDGVVTPDFRGVLEADDGGVILCTWHGYGRTGPAGERQLVGSITHVTGETRYQWLNNVFGAVNGEVRPRPDGRLDVVLEVSELVWEPLSVSDPVLDEGQRDAETD